MKMQKIIVIGSGGAGKSTLAVRLGECLGLPVVHLDALYWQPGWAATPKPEWQEKVTKLVKADTWVMDGNFSGTMDIRLAACDTVIFLDVPRIVCVWRALNRWVKYWRRTRPDMGAGCPEKVDWDYLRWIWTYSVIRKPNILAMLEHVRNTKCVLIFRSLKEIDAFIERLEAQSHPELHT